MWDVSTRIHVSRSVCLWILAQVIPTSLLTKLKPETSLSILEMCLPSVSHGRAPDPVSESCSHQGIGFFNASTSPATLGHLTEGTSAKRLQCQGHKTYSHFFKPPISTSELCVTASGRCRWDSHETKTSRPYSGFETASQPLSG